MHNYNLHKCVNSIYRNIHKLIKYELILMLRENSRQLEHTYHGAQ